MSLKRANLLERAGKFEEAIEENLKLIDNNTQNKLGQIAQSNISRIFSRLDSNRKEVLSNKISTIKSKPEIRNNLKSAPGRLPLVSIVVPCFNAEKFIDHTIASLESQTYDNFEVILVDDFSDDGTVKICKKISQRDSRFRFYQHRANGGLAAARNSGTRLAKGDFICYLDSDDLLADTSISQRVALLSQYSMYESVAGVYDQSVSIEHGFTGRIVPNESGMQRKYVDFISAFGDCPFNSNQPLVKKEVVLEMGGFPEQYPQAEDWRLWAKILRAGYVFLLVNRVGSGYRQTMNSMIRRAPLLHVEKSTANYFRSFRRCEDEIDPLELRYENYSYAKPIFCDSVGTYLGKHKFLPRVFNFLGIEYGRMEFSGQSLDYGEISRYLLKLEPDFALVFSGHSLDAAVGWALTGYKRFYGIKSLEPNKKSEVEKFIISVVNDLIPTDRRLPEKDLGVILFDRPIRKNDIEVIDVLFVPHKYYHTYSFSLLLDELDRRNINYKFLDVSVPYRDEAAKIPELSGSFFSYNEFVLSRLVPRVIVCMNDWDTVVRPFVEKANLENIPTVGIVEGVQDYLDLDTGRRRNPYRTVSSVFLPGDFDKKYFAGSNQKLYSVGVQRLEGLGEFKRLRPGLVKANCRKPFVVLNVNFSYGVLVEKRARWIESVCRACEKVGLELVISQHPQDTGDLSAYNVSKEPLYHLLTEAKFFISRFSGAILEALVIGCPVIYFNGLGERVDKFTCSLGAYDIANTTEELISVLSRREDSVRSVGDFLKLHACYGDASIVGRTVDALEDILRNEKITFENFINFKNSLLS